MTRLNKLRAVFPEDLDVILITDRLNCRYLSGVNYTDGFLLILRDKAYLFADSRYIEIARKNAGDQFEKILISGKRDELLAPYIKDCRRIGYEDSSMTCAALKIWQKSLPAAVFSEIGPLVSELRNIKEESEKQNIIKAQRIAEKAFLHVLGIISTDISEKDLALELEFFMRKNGAESVAFDTIAVSGKNSSLPHGEPSEQKIQKGFLTMDFGAKVNGYCSDMTRTVCVGKPDEEMKKVYSTVLEAQTAALDFISAGKKCSDADAVARNIIDEAGYKGLFGHGLGHGVGLYIHEGLSLSPRSEQVFKKGNVVTVEPGIYIAGKYGVRIEDMLYIDENCTENLTRCDKELIII